MIAGTGFRFADIDDVMPRYAARVRRSRADADHLEWIAKQCREREAVCLECDDGFMVMAAGPCGAEVRAKLLLAAGQPGAFARREADIVAVARDLGASEVSFRADHRAWHRVLRAPWATDGNRFWRAI